MRPTGKSASGVADFATIQNRPGSDAPAASDLGDVLITPQLATRSCRPVDLEGEAASLQKLAGLVLDDPQQAIGSIVGQAVAACRAGSAGLSLLETGPDGSSAFRWTDVSGPLGLDQPFEAPRHNSLSGLCIDAGQTVLAGHLSQAFDNLDGLRHPIFEALCVPLHDTGRKPLGTFWVVHHDPSDRFDAEDARLVEQLASLAVLALKLRETRSSAQQADGTPGGAAVAVQPGQPCYSLGLKLEGFARLTDADNMALAQANVTPRTVPAHTDLVREGEPPDGVTLVLEGFACRYKLRASGSRQIMAYLLPGDLCDLDTALHGDMDHTIGTLSVCTVASLSREQLLDWQSRPSGLARALRIGTLVDESTLREWLMNVGRRSAEERIAHLFCELLVRLQVVGLVRDNSYALPITQVDLADTTGISVVHVNRTLQELRRRKLITLVDQVLTILDVPGLMNLAEFKPNYLHVRAGKAKAAA